MKLLEAKQERALEELLTSRQRFVQVACAILLDREDAEDAVQDAFLSAYRNVGNFEGRSAHTTWFTRIVINAALMIRRKRKNESLRSFRYLDTDGAVFVETIQDIQPSPELAYSQNESSAFLDALLNKIKPRFREAVRMAYYGELSAPEASSALGISVSTYKARLLRGRRLLQQEARRTNATWHHWNQAVACFRPVDRFTDNV